MYHSVLPLVQSAVRGYNATVFAYGNTGSGKTHTMMGSPAMPGITPRAVRDIFSMIQTTAARNSDTIFLVRMSYVELYNNTFRNLLEGSHHHKRAAGLEKPDVDGGHGGYRRCGHCCRRHVACRHRRRHRRRH